MNITLPLWGFILVIVCTGGFAHILLSLLISARRSEQIEFEIAYREAEEENRLLKEENSNLEKMIRNQAS